jgi:hypothetical protein
MPPLDDPNHPLRSRGRPVAHGAVSTRPAEYDLDSSFDLTVFATEPGREAGTPLAPGTVTRQIPVPPPRFLVSEEPPAATRWIVVAVVAAGAAALAALAFI